MDLYKEINSLENSFGVIKRDIKRSFLTMKRYNTYLQTSTSSTCFHNLALILNGKEFSSKLIQDFIKILLKLKIKEFNLLNKH